MSSVPERRIGDFTGDLTRRGFDFIWEWVPEFSFRRKVEWIQAVSDAHPDTWLVFTDAYDFILLAESPGEVIETLEALGPGPIFQADPLCWPLPVEDRYRELQKGTDAAGSYWRYVNGCGPSGKGWAISMAAAHLRARHPITSDVPSDLAGNDQRAWTETYLDGIGDVDYRCRLIQCIHALPESGVEWDGKRIYNHIMGTWPCFAHLCGHSDNAWNALKGNA